jgi:virulence-associated protein VapD
MSIYQERRYAYTFGMYIESVSTESREKWKKEHEAIAKELGKHSLIAEEA